MVFAISLGMVPHVCGELLAASPQWRSMVDNVGVVGTQAFQLWLSEEEQALGWRGPAGVTMSGFVTPFDTWASMTHLLPTEDWPETDAPRTIAYFCSALATPDAPDGAPDAERETRAVRERAQTFLDRDVAALWPAAVENGGFRWSLLCDGTPSAVSGAERLDTQYWRANIDPSDLYVQSLPGTDQFRLQPSSSGFTNLTLAGDWTDNGLNAGCVEGAVRSGQLAAQAVRAQLAGTKTARRRMSGSDGDAFATGAAEAARLAQEVQELGFAAARTIVERFVEMFGQFAATNGEADQPSRDGGGAPPPFWLRGSDGSMRKMQSDMLRASDAYMAVLSQLNEAGLRFFDAARWWEPPRTDRDDLLLPRVAPGGRTSARLWLHNTTTSTATGLRAWCPGLASHAGASIAAAAVTCQPERIDRLEPDASRELVVTVAVGPDAAPGTYHGQLLVDGLPDVVFPMRVSVLPETDL